MAEAVRNRYGDEYLAYETERQLDYRAIALRSLAEAGLVPAPGVPGRRLLEIGCATGALLAAFAEGGWAVTGVEIGPSMAAYGARRWNLDIRVGTLEEARLEPARYDAVLASHLIEHLNDPRAFLGEAKRLLKADGRLYLLTPNADGFQPRLLGERWRSAIRDHLYLFSLRTLKAMLALEGFAVEYAGTWGGWPAGMKPAALKKPLDRAAKALGLGDVMVLRAVLA